jgi:glycosyltransferase involved in cell wall biosynthesis
VTSLRIGIDGDTLRIPFSGVGHYVFNLCRELDMLLSEASFIVYSRLPASAVRLPSSRWQLRSESVAAYGSLPSFVWLKTRCRSMCATDRLDVFWAGRTLHPGPSAGVRTVCTVHDVNHLVRPETMQFQTRWSHRLWFRRDVLSADCVLANSYGTAERVRTMLRAKVRDVVPPGVAPQFHPPTSEEEADIPDELSRLGVRLPYLLSVAATEPRKNLDAVLGAYLNLKRSGQLSEHRLVLAGPTGWKNRAIAQKLAEAQAYGVVQVGYVPDHLMPRLYAGAEVLVFPSLYEGFGMPVLEARACGTKVVISDVPELREAGGPNAIIVNPSVEGIERGIMTATTTPARKEMDLAASYSWRRSGERLADILTHG